MWLATIAVPMCLPFIPIDFTYIRLITKRKSTGQTPYQYLLDQRMERAKMLLKIGRDSIQEIALECGFNSG
jgi:methylphosphotriester-DNA--protein-cysteine methyltransferase